jgi:AraC family transcriptional regulator
MDLLHTKKILEILVYIETHMDEPLLLSKLSKIARISPYYFHRLFKAYVHMTPKEYVKRVQMLQSAKRLQYSHMPITEIALAAGYAEPSSFSRAFQQAMKKSPTLYRKEQLVPFSGWGSLPKPTYVYRADETVLFLRKIGDYRETVAQGILKCLELDIQSCFGMAIDDPLTVPRKACRFDVCVKASAVPGKEWGQKRIAGGKYAVFVQSGIFSTLEELFTRCFHALYFSGVRLRFSGSFCEYRDLPRFSEFHKDAFVTATYYVPVQR